MKRTVIGFFIIFTLLIQSVFVFAERSNPEISQKWIDVGIFNSSDNASDKIPIGDLAVIIDKIMGYQVKTELDYHDLPQLRYTDAVKKGVFAGVVRVDDLGLNFATRAGENALREDAAYMFARMLKIDKESSDAFSYNDKGLINVHNLGYVNALVKIGAMDVTKEGHFLPKLEITKGEVSKILDKTIANVYTKSGLYEKKSIFNDDLVGDVIINSSDVKLRNLVINGDLFISESVKSGSITLEDVTVFGNIYSGATSKTINFDGRTKANALYIENNLGTSNVNIDKNAEISKIYVKKTGDGLVISGPFKDIEIGEKSNVRLRKAIGNSVTIKGEYSTLYVDGFSEVKSVSTDYRALIMTNGAINSVNVNGTDSTVINPPVYVLDKYKDSTKEYIPLYSPNNKPYVFIG